ncbi:hypothetical protein F2P56_031016 [Juglans regia]|uniref:Uncharacterized protein LOC108980504 n=2 Tax=Juglans regia TaxID=51240 RepID=A0A2I4DIL3_JUGRE|nr:uncharacterized protein LOC108980504 [Juglans regia]XP_018806986.1 uncharacterized protein LOC108980504 [Juglans regia]KAF5450685.1 hypothetical protein F2P56_031015 [Juglans regia]KAF5450686.1 hypothetical protein F2P56_031016 [Juglans regia]
MQQRKSASGRPSGTDGSDFSYRMVVDSRYQKVASGKSRLSSLIFTQAVIQLIGTVCTVLSISKEDPDRIAIFAIAVGFVSLILGELGQRRSRVGLLKIYMVGSSTTILLWLACLSKSNFMLELIRDPSKWETKKLELLETALVLFGFLVQVFTIGTATSLISNMSPPKRAS